MVTATINRALSCERWPSQRRSGSQRTRRTRACYTEYLLTLPIPVIPDALQTDRKLRSFTMISFIPVSTGTFLFRKDDLTADLSALRGLLSNCLLLCYRHDGQGGHTEVKDKKKLRRITLILLIVKLVCDVISLISYQRKDDSTKH